MTVKTHDEVPAHMERVAARWAHLDGPGHNALLARVDYFNNHTDVEARAHAHEAAQRAKSVAAKVTWLRADAGEVLKAAESVSACRRGCGDCCHIGVTVARAEAEVIGKAIGRKVANPPEARVLNTVDMLDDPNARERMKHMRKQQAWLRDAYHGVACTFLNRHGSCTIYENRPLICRWQINLDADSLLCELVPQDVEAIKVPYLNMTNMHAVYAANFGGSPLADLRDWFPAKGAA